MSPWSGQLHQNLEDTIDAARRPSGHASRMGHSRTAIKHWPGRSTVSVLGVADR